MAKVKAFATFFYVYFSQNRCVSKDIFFEFFLRVYLPVDPNPLFLIPSAESPSASKYF